jgi:dihydroorotase-like cyclic amidohydrolase
VQTLYLSCLDLAKKLGDVWLAPRWVSEGPADAAGLQASKGAIAPGFDADLVIVDPNRKTQARSDHMRSRQRHAALEGMEFGFGIEDVYLRGESVLSNGRVRGRMVRPALVAR